jgi:hypothetical protein
MCVMMRLCGLGALSNEKLPRSNVKIYSLCVHLKMRGWINCHADAVKDEYLRLFLYLVGESLIFNAL